MSKRVELYADMTSKIGHGVEMVFTHELLTEDQNRPIEGVNGRVRFNADRDKRFIVIG
jgi:hypothetical protein